MNRKAIPSIFFDQNIMEKMSKKRYYSFQNNVHELVIKKRHGFIQQYTPFGLLEFAGLNKQEIFDIQYQGRCISEYPFRLYKEVDHNNFIYILKEQICKKITKSFLKEKLEEKKKREFKYLNQRGLQYINQYVKCIDFMYDVLVDNLLLDRVSQVNTSKFLIKERQKFVALLFILVMDIICNKNIMGSFRIICKLHQGLKNSQIKSSGGLRKKSIFFDTAKQMSKITEGLKTSGDLVDCELVHLAFFGFDNHHCHCYTTDSEKVVMNRLKLYCEFVNFLIYYFFDRKTIGYQHNRPEWKCGKVFILDRDTGEKIKKISATKIYEQVVNIKGY